MSGGRRNFSKAHGRMVLVGQVWEVRIPMCEPYARQEPRPMRVMAVAEGYAMCRFPGAMPFVEPIAKWRPEWRLLNTAMSEADRRIAVGKNGGT